MNLLKSFLLTVTLIALSLTFMVVLVTRPEWLLIPVAIGFFGWMWWGCHDLLEHMKD